MIYLSIPPIVVALLLFIVICVFCFPLVCATRVGIVSFAVSGLFMKLKNKEGINSVPSAYSSTEHAFNVLASQDVTIDLR